LYAGKEVSEESGFNPSAHKCSRDKRWFWLVSADGLRVYRYPSSKPNSPYATTGVQANFESKMSPTGRPYANGHLNIAP
jgi:hypothetical protein